MDIVTSCKRCDLYLSIFHPNRLGSPLSVADSTAVLILETLCICLDIENIACTGIGLRWAGLIWTGDRLQMRQGGIQLRIGIQRGYHLFGASSAREAGLQDKRLFRIGWNHLLFETTVAAEKMKLTLLLL